jgi:hypothetical protein
MLYDTPATYVANACLGFSVRHNFEDNLSKILRGSRPAEHEIGPVLEC